MTRVPLVAGNWKMNGLRAGLIEVAAVQAATGAGAAGRAEILICPPATLLMAAADLCRGSAIALGGQDCHPESLGAYTGDVSADMLKDAGASYVIIGHSERRAAYGESDIVCRAKASAGLRAELSVILCVGETRIEREIGQAYEVVGTQLAGSIPHDVAGHKLVIAYEPIWAIGTGLTPTEDDVAAMHTFIRAELARLLPGKADRVRILYGGSVKPANAAALLAIPNVDGALVGGASLKATEFMAIAFAYR